MGFNIISPVMPFSVLCVVKAGLGRLCFIINRIRQFSELVRLSQAVRPKRCGGDPPSPTFSSCILREYENQ